MDKHYHACPLCYQNAECTASECSIHPDLCEGWSEENQAFTGRLFGSTTECGRCLAEQKAARASTDRMTLPDDPREALREIAGYLATVDMRPERAVCEHEDPEGCQPRLSVRSYFKNADPSIIGYYQLTGWLKGVLELAQECERIAALIPVSVQPAEVAPTRFYSKGQLSQATATEENLRTALSAHGENIIVGCYNEVQERARIAAMGLPMQRFRFLTISPEAKP